MKLKFFSAADIQLVNFESNLLQPDCIYILFIVSEKCFIILIISNSSEDLSQSLQEIRVLTPEMKLISASFFPLL